MDKVLLMGLSKIKIYQSYKVRWMLAARSVCRRRQFHNYKKILMQILEDYNTINFNTNSNKEIRII